MREKNYQLLHELFLKCFSTYIQTYMEVLFRNHILLCRLKFCLIVLVLGETTYKGKIVLMRCHKKDSTFVFCFFLREKKKIARAPFK